MKCFYKIPLFWLRSVEDLLKIIMLQQFVKFQNLSFSWSWLILGNGGSKKTDRLTISDVFLPLYFPVVRKTAGQRTKLLTSKFTIFWTHVVCQPTVDPHMTTVLFSSWWMCTQRKGHRYPQIPSSVLEEVSWEVNPLGLGLLLNQILLCSKGQW